MVKDNNTLYEITIKIIRIIIVKHKHAAKNPFLDKMQTDCF